MQIVEGAHQRNGAARQTAPLKTCVLSWLALAAGGWLVIAGAVYALARALS